VERGNVAKPIAFRPTKDNEDFIKNFKQQNPDLKKDSEVMNKILEQARQPQKLEQTPRKSLCLSCYYEYTPHDFYDNPKYNGYLGYGFYLREHPHAPQ